MFSRTSSCGPVAPSRLFNILTSCIHNRKQLFVTLHDHGEVLLLTQNCIELLSSCHSSLENTPLAATLLFPIDQINKSVTLFGKEEIDRYLPQSGHMRMVDRVLWISESGTSIVGARIIRDDEFWVAGHIPGRPLFPGVLMIEAAAQVCSIAHTRLGRTTGFTGFTRCDDVVFRGQVVPGDEFVLLADEIDFNRRRFICRTQGLVKDKLVFEATITGMAI